MNTAARFSVLQETLLAALKQIKPGMPTRKADQRDDMLTHVFITAEDSTVTISFPLSDVKPVVIGAKIDIPGVTVIHFKTLFDVTKLTPRGRMDFVATEYAAGENNGYGYTFSEAGTEVVLTADLTRTRLRTALVSNRCPVEELAEDLSETITAETAPVTSVSLKSVRPLTHRERLDIQRQLLNYLNERYLTWNSNKPISSSPICWRSGRSSTAPSKSQRHTVSQKALCYRTSTAPNKAQRSLSASVTTTVTGSSRKQKPNGYGGDGRVGVNRFLTRGMMRSFGRRWHGAITATGREPLGGSGIRNQKRHRLSKASGVRPAACQCTRDNGRVSRNGTTRGVCRLFAL